MRLRKAGQYQVRRRRPWELIRPVSRVTAIPGRACGGVSFGLPDPWPPGEPWPDSNLGVQWPGWMVGRLRQAAGLAARSSTGARLAPRRACRGRDPGRASDAPQTSLGVRVHGRGGLRRGLLAARVPRRPRRHRGHALDGDRGRAAVRTCSGGRLPARRALTWRRLGTRPSLRGSADAAGAVPRSTATAACATTARASTERSIGTSPAAGGARWRSRIRSSLDVGARLGGPEVSSAARGDIVPRCPRAGRVSNVKGLQQRSATCRAEDFATGPIATSARRSPPKMSVRAVIPLRARVRVRGRS